MNEEIIDVIGVIDGYGYQLSVLRYQLNRCKSKKVRCRVNSPGGSINEALVMSQLIADHGNVTIQFMGMVASAATIMAFGAKRIEANEDSMWLCHKCSTPVSIYKAMNADELNETIKKLQADKKSNEAIDLMIASKYLDRCKIKNKSLSDILSLMDENRWMRASEAAEWGFIDEVIKGVNPISIDDRARMVQNCADLHLPSLPDDFNLQPTQPSIVDQIVNRIMAFVNRDKENVSNHYINMKKNFCVIASILGLVEFKTQEGQVMLDDEQMKKIEEHINKLEEDKTKSSNRVNEVESKLNAMGENIAKMANLDDKINAVAQIIQNMPGANVPGVVVPEKNNAAVEDFAKDEVMAYLDERNSQSIF